MTLNQITKKSAESAEPRSGEYLLGIQAQSVDTPESQGKSADAETARAQIWQMLKTRRDALQLSEVTSRACGYERRPDTLVSVIHRPSSNSAGFSGLKMCDSDTCPVCAPRRALEHKRLLRAALVSAERTHSQALMLTLTLSHKRADRCKDTLTALKSAWRTLQQSRAWRAFTQHEETIGAVSHLEITYGMNGFHPHLHILIINNLPLHARRVNGYQIKLAQAWQAAARKHGYVASLERGADLVTAESKVAEYVAKWGHMPTQGERWGAEHEMSGGFSRKKSAGGLTVFELLAVAAGVANADTLKNARLIWQYEDVREKALEAYLEVYYAKKGMALVVWSRGLKDALDVEAIALELDEAVAAQEIEAEVAYTAVTFTVRGWDAVRRLNIRADVLNAVASGDYSRLLALVREHRIACAIADEFVVRHAAKIIF